MKIWVVGAVATCYCGEPIKLVSSHDGPPKWWHQNRSLPNYNKTECIMHAEPVEDE